MRQYRFRALVTLDQAAREGPARRLPGRTHALTTHACCLVQPFCHPGYFPAVIARDEELPLPPRGRAMMTITLADGEAEAFFAPGKRFTIWADGAVGRTIRGEGLIGYGVISRRTAPSPARADSGIRGRVNGPRRRHRLAAAGTTTADNPDQDVAV